MSVSRRSVLAGGASLLAAPAIAQTRAKVKFAGGGITVYGYMPFFVANGRQLWQKHGIDPDLAMFPGGAPAMQAVLGGSSHVACGYYEHTIQMAAKGAKLTAFVLQTQNSGLVLAARKSLTDIRTPADLKGRGHDGDKHASRRHPALRSQQYLRPHPARRDPQQDRL